jgi:hypothetical protein
MEEEGALSSSDSMKGTASGSDVQDPNDRADNTVSSRITGFVFIEMQRYSFSVIRRLSIVIPGLTRNLFCKMCTKLVRI